MLALLLGDAREVFADQLFAKADAYFHRGKYPSVFETNARQEPDRGHLMGEACPLEGHDHGEEGGNHDHDHSLPHQEIPANSSNHRRRDWIAAFGQRFRPAEHAHLEAGNEREMLPWLRLAGDMDPHRVEVYSVTAYWLRDRMGRTDQAEQFLRKGLKANPDSPELFYELGRLMFESRKDVTRARNLWQRALTKWSETEGQKADEERNDLLRLQILASLARLEFDAGFPAKAIDYLEQLKAVSPYPEAVQSRINELRSRDSGPQQPPE